MFRIYSTLTLTNWFLGPLAALKVDSTPISTTWFIFKTRLVSLLDLPDQRPREDKTFFFRRTHTHTHTHRHTHKHTNTHKQTNTHTRTHRNIHKNTHDFGRISHILFACFEVKSDLGFNHSCLSSILKVPLGGYLVL